MRNSLASFAILLLLTTHAFSQSPPDEFHLLFYNVENLFDTYDDPETSDEEFTPSGSRHWTSKRLNKKLLLLSKVLISASGWTPPQIIALCETENIHVLEKLLKDTPLKKYPYQIIQKDSPDPRGIDVALLYNSEAFYPLQYSYIPVYDNDSILVRTREILYVQGILNQADTLHVFVNHWPSRYSGLLESKQNRNQAAATLRWFVDSLVNAFHNPKIIIAGDFNDQPTDESLTDYLNAKSPISNPDAHDLYNLSHLWMKDEIKTLKHQSQWSVFDQFIVSGSMLNAKNKIYTQPGLASIISAPFLLEQDEKFGHYRLNRTYYGFKYHGGFSDHLPILLKIRMNP